MDNAQIIFIIGCPRSGTTLLRDILIADRRIAIPDEELQIVPKLIEYLDTNSKHKLITLLKRSPFGHFNPEFNFDTLTIHGKDLQQKWFSLFSQLSSNESAIFFGEKTPENYKHLDLLTNYFTSAKFLFVVRDPRDVVVSMRKAWGKSYILGIRKWKEANEQRNRFMVSADIHSLFYESLLKNPSDTIKQIGDWLECENLDEVALKNFVQSKEAYGDSKGIRGIVSSNSKKYHQACPKFVHASIEYLLREEMPCDPEI